MFDSAGEQIPWLECTETQPSPIEFTVTRLEFGEKRPS